MIFVRGEHQRLRPASNMKVLTAVSALDLLGADYRFATTLQASGEPDDSASVKNIYIRGGWIHFSGATIFVPSSTRCVNMACGTLPASGA